MFHQYALHCKTVSDCEFIIFGGSSNTKNVVLVFSDMWSYNLTSKEWKEITPSVYIILFRKHDLVDHMVVLFNIMNILFHMVVFIQMEKKIIIQIKY